MKFLALLFILGTAVGNDRHYRVVTIDTPPYIYKTEGDEQRLSGFLIDVMDEMSGRLNFSYEVAEVADKRFGRPVDGRWNGMIGDLVRNDADIALAPLTITRERAEVVKFGRPFMDASISGIMKRPAPGQEMPISELSDLPASGLHYETFKGGSTYRFFVNSTDPMMAAIGAQMETTTFRENMADAIQRVTGEGGVFIGEVPGLAWVAGQAPCNLTLVGKPITSSDFALAFGNDFIGDVEAFNWEILGMKTDGTFNKLYTKHFQRQCEAPKLCMCQTSSETSEEATP